MSRVGRDFPWECGARSAKGPAPMPNGILCQNVEAVWMVSVAAEARSGGQVEAEGREREWFLGGGCAPSPPARGSGERYKLPQRGSGRSSDRKRMSV